MTERSPQPDTDVGDHPHTPPKKRRTAVIAGIVLVVLVVGGGVALYARTQRSANSPEGVRAAYIAAYENHDFGEVVDNACSTYKREFGTDTSALEQNSRPFEIDATAVGEPALRGDAATANIDLDLSQGGNSERVRIFIRMEKEDGVWRFCGEGTREE